MRSGSGPMEQGKKYSDMIRNQIGICLLAMAGMVSGCNDSPTLDAPQTKAELLGTDDKVERVYPVSGLDGVPDGAQVSLFTSMFPEQNNLFTKSGSELQGTIPAKGVVCGVYPSDAAMMATVVGSQFVIETPGLGPQTLGATASDAEMSLSVAVSNGEELSFKELLGSVQLPLRASGEDVEITSLRIVGNNGEYLSGPIEITASEVGTPVARVSTSSGSQELVCQGPVTIEAEAAAQIVVKLLPQHFTQGLKLYFTKSDGTITERDVEPLVVERKETALLPEVLFEQTTPQYYIDYVATAEVTVTGCKGEYDAATQKGRIYLENPVITDGMFKVDTNPSAANLTEVYLPSEIEAIGVEAFWNCMALSKLTVGPDSQLATIGNSAFGKCGSGSDPLGILFDFSSVTKVTYLGDLMFAEARFRNNDLSTLPKSVEHLQGSLFRNLASSAQDTFDLSALTNLKLLEGNIFAGCKDGKMFIFPSSVTTFRNFTFPDKIIGYTVVIPALEPPVVESSFLNGNVSQIQVPADKVEAYKAAAGWSTYASKIVAISE